MEVNCHPLATRLRCRYFPCGYFLKETQTGCLCICVHYQKLSDHNQKLSWFHLHEFPLIYNDCKCICWPKLNCTIVLDLGIWRALYGLVNFQRNILKQPPGENVCFISLLGIPPLLIQDVRNHIESQNWFGSILMWEKFRIQPLASWQTDIGPLLGGCRSCHIYVFENLLWQGYWLQLHLSSQ